MVPRPFVIKRFRKETDDTFTVELEPKEARSRFVFGPGQFNMVYVYGVGEVPISISGSPSSPGLVHTTRAVGTVTKAMAKLKKGDIVGIRGPYGTTWPVKEARSHDVVVVAGGIGLPPLRGAIYEILDNRKDYGKVVLLYGVGTPSDILFTDELEQWRSRFDMEVFITVDRAAPEWRGNVGVVTTLISKAGFDPLNTIAMIVGPEVMMRFTALEFIKQGCESRLDLSVDGAEHEVWHRPVRALPVRSIVCVQRRACVPIHSDQRPAGEVGNLTGAGFSPFTAQP